MARSRRFPEENDLLVYACTRHIGQCEKNRNEIKAKIGMRIGSANFQM